MDTPAEIWEKSLHIMRKEVGQSVYELWFEPIIFKALDDGNITLEVPNRFFKEWIEDYHPTLISDTIEKLTARPVDVSYKITAKPAAEVKKVEARREKRKDRLAKRMTPEDIRPTSDDDPRPRAHKLTMENFITKHKTVLLMEELELDVPIDDEVFSQRNMTQ